MLGRRKQISFAEKKIVFKKTGGRCHFCAKKLKFSAKSGEFGRWQVDHIYPKIRGGADGLENYLAICNKCNRLRWCFDPKRIRKIFNYGIIAYRQAKKKTSAGKEIRKIHIKNREKNQKRRKKQKLIE